VFSSFLRIIRLGKRHLQSSSAAELIFQEQSGAVWGDEILQLVHKARNRNTVKVKKEFTGALQPEGKKRVDHEKVGRRFPQRSWELRRGTTKGEGVRQLKGNETTLLKRRPLQLAYLNFDFNLEGFPDGEVRPCFAMWRREGDVVFDREWPVLAFAPAARSAGA
jgi:hypothetical protein